MASNLFFKKIEYRYVVAAIYAIVLFLDRLDLTIVNITLPTLANYFNVPITHTEWVNNAFLLALAISIPISGWAGDRFGTKKIFIIATGIFGIASFLCAFSPNLTSMIMMRFLQGLGGGMIIPVGMTMVYRVFDKSEYASITSFIFIPTLIAPAVAPALGGAIIHFFSWQWVFLFAVPICLLAVFLSIFILKEQVAEKLVSLDWLGFILSSAALVFLFWFISSLGKYGIDMQTVYLLVTSVFLAYFFLKYEKHNEHPLINIKFFKNTLFSQANLIQLAFQICHFGSIFLVGMYLQVSVGMSAMVSGMIMGMQALGAIATSRFSVKLFHRVGPVPPIVTGFIGIAIFTSCILFITNTSMVFFGAALLFVRGLFSGLCGTPIQTMSVIGFEKNDVSRASAVFNAGRQISISLGIALSSLLISYGFRMHGVSGELLLGQLNRSIFYYAFLLIPFVAAFGIFVSLSVNNKKIVGYLSKSL